MIDWKYGGLTGSINAYARRDVRDLLRHNATARRCRYGSLHSLVRGFFSIARFARFLWIYLALDALAVATEATWSWFAPRWLPWPSASPDLKALLLNVASYLITAQVGALGAISLALALVTLIAQRDDASTDVTVYYHQSLAFEVVASCIALLAVLCAQLLWPAQYLLHQTGLGTVSPFFKVFLLGIHLLWLLVNLAGLAHFIATTFGFVHREERQRLRERYTANVSFPIKLMKRIRRQLYGTASIDKIAGIGNSNGLPSVEFGSDPDTSSVPEIGTHFASSMILYDVRMALVQWVLHRWSDRCIEAAGRQPHQSHHGAQGPVIYFTPPLDVPFRGRIEWCQRHGGVRLRFYERWLLRRAFRFRRTNDGT